MRGITRIAVMCLLPVAPWASATETPLAVFPINEESVAGMRKQFPLASVEVNDPVYKRKQRYQGFWLRDVLKNFDREGHPEAGLYLRFRCKDGYLPVMALTRVLPFGGRASTGSFHT